MQTNRARHLQLIISPTTAQNTNVKGKVASGFLFVFMLGILSATIFIQKNQASEMASQNLAKVSTEFRTPASVR